jgi:hypothetical protein
MAIKKGSRNWFCDNCGEITTSVATAVRKVPKLCVHCLGDPGGARLNEDAVDFLIEQIREQSTGVKQGSSAHHKVNFLRLRLARLFLQEISNKEHSIHCLPDGPDKNSKCKNVVEHLNELALKIYPFMEHVEEEE